MLTGELVRLRPMEPSEAEHLWRWNSDPEVMRWMDEGYPQTLAQVARRCEDRPVNSYDDVLLGVETLDGGRLIGLVRLSDAQPEIGRATFDVYIGEKDCWGRGYATDATREMCRYGFGRMRLHSIELSVVTENVSAIHVYEKVGFVREGRLREVFRRDGRWYDMFLMSMLEGELRD
ncbi:GNAT family protein [Streptosporangium sp. NPDC048047]|uniref:GNAT family N-acetyltransferase n=1 Tax=Streptosporangium sp. NPDC048047 TaxID=3155748 RepID=UPI0034462FBC